MMERLSHAVKDSIPIVAVALLWYIERHLREILKFLKKENE